VITGGISEVDFFLQILACLVRRPLQLGDFKSSTLSSLMRIQPTLLVSRERLSASKLQLLISSNNPNCYFSMGAGLANFYSAKVFYGGIGFPEDFSGNAVLHIHLTPLRGRLPILGLKEQDEIAGKFQPQLLDYRLTKFRKVQESRFDFPWLPSNLRILARILGAPIIDAPDRQPELEQMFQRLKKADREQAWVDERCVAIEACLAICHKESGENWAYVGKLAECANVILKARGDAKIIEPKRMGELLRSFGFSPERDAKGYSVCLTPEVRRQIHSLAFQFDVAALSHGAVPCENCLQILVGGESGGASRSEGKGSSNR
jgi:hypothetical protein